MFGFIKYNLNIEKPVLDYFYKILVVLERGIRPTKDACRPLSEYALNCVSQSNSAKARQIRVEIFNDLFLNESKTPNTTQSEILEFYSLGEKNIVKKGKYYVFELESLRKAFETFHSKV